MSDLPTLLRVQRAQRRLTQARAARVLGQTLYRYRRLETAEERPTASEVSKIAKTFGVPKDDVRAAVSVTVTQDGAVSA